MSITLPKGYISYSAASLWNRNKDAFRQSYYSPQGRSLSTVQMDYGRDIADLLKDNPDDPLVAHVLKYLIRDEGFIVDIEGIPVMLFPDSLSTEETPSFIEYKTGEWVEGKPAWSQEKCDQSKQLKLYSLGIKEKFGSVNDKCKLIWLVTEMQSVSDGIKINGKQYGVTIEVPHLTGEVITFETVITDLERFRAKQWIVQAAHEIAADYQLYKKHHAPRSQ